MKQMIMTAFPRVSGPMDTITADQMEGAFLNVLRQMNSLLKMQESDPYSKILSKTARV